MKIEVFGASNPDGCSHQAWTYEIDPACERVLVTVPGFYRDQKEPKVWGFLKDGKQVNGELVAHDPQQIWVA